jgi:hypothetical protein
MKHYLLLAMVLLLASCQKSTTKPQAASVSIDDGMAFVDTTNATETVIDTVQLYNDNPNGGYVFDSCTNEWVHVWGKIHIRIVNWFADSVKQINTSEMNYENVQGVGNVTGQKYKYNYQGKGIQYSVWGGEYFVEKVNFSHSHSKLTPVSGGSSYVTDTYFYFVTDNAGDLIINQQHYDFGSCH